MKTITVILCAGLLATLVGGCLAPASSRNLQADPTPNPVPVLAEKELMALDQAWIDAEVGHDKAALEKILDERFLVTSSSGATVDRASFIARILGKKISPFEVIHDTIVVHSASALVIDLTSDRTTKFTWIAVKKNGQWRVISETMTKVTPAK